MINSQRCNDFIGLVTKYAEAVGLFGDFLIKSVQMTSLAAIYRCKYLYRFVYNVLPTSTQ
jgi:hypothetical protein